MNLFGYFLIMTNYLTKSSKEGKELTVQRKGFIKKLKTNIEKLCNFEKKNCPFKLFERAMNINLEIEYQKSHGLIRNKINWFSKKGKNILWLMEKSFSGYSSDIDSYIQKIIKNLFNQYRLTEGEEIYKQTYFKIDANYTELPKYKCKWFYCIRENLVKLLDIRNTNITAVEKSQENIYELKSLFYKCMISRVKELGEWKISENIDNVIPNYKIDYLFLLDEIFITLRNIDKSTHRIIETVLIFLDLCLIYFKNDDSCLEYSIQKNILLLYCLTTYMEKRWKDGRNMSKTDDRRFKKAIDYLIDEFLHDRFKDPSSSSETLKEIFEMINGIEEENEAMFIKTLLTSYIIIDYRYIKKLDHIKKNIPRKYNKINGNLIYKTNILQKIAEKFIKK